MFYSALVDGVHTVGASKCEQVCIKTDDLWSPGVNFGPRKKVTKPQGGRAALIDTNVCTQMRQSCGALQRGNKSTHDAPISDGEVENIAPNPTP